jgi:catechol 2,3-dioxygenase-like lactoylglutathione lyase family enzyme
MIPTRSLNHLTLRVSDLERSICFYQDLLGFDVRWRSNSSAYLESGTLWLALLLRPVQPFSDHLAGMDHFALTVAEADFDAAVDELNRHEVEIVKGPIERGVGHSIYFRDPDGIVVELHTSGLDARMTAW